MAATLKARSREDLLKALMDAYGKNGNDAKIQHILRELKKRQEKKEDPQQRSIAHMLGSTPQYLN